MLQKNAGKTKIRHDGIFQRRVSWMRFGFGVLAVALGGSQIGQMTL
jgi:hypothetical protein